MNEELRPYGTDSTDPPAEPLTREEQYLSAIAGVTSSSDIPPKPLTRTEKYLNKIVENGGGGGGGGTTDYNDLSNKPKLNSVELTGNLSLPDVGAQAALDTDQMAAVNSGVTSTDVAQIGTNKNNISLANKNIDNISTVFNDGKYIIKSMGEVPFINTADNRIKISSNELNIGDTVYLTDNNYRIALAITGTTDTTPWTDEPITITATRRSVGFKKADNANISNMSSNEVASKIYVANKSNIQKQIDTLANSYGGKIAHISFDDVKNCMADITANASTYDTIFDNAFFAELKTLHEQFGAIFSLYVFSENLSNYTNTFASDFSSNSNWLKFGFHALNANSNFENTTAAQAKTIYDAFTTQIMRITGNVDCIDRCPRLGNFKGNLESMLAIRDCDGGIIGALSAYDTRDSYYLTSADSAYVKQHGKLYDATNYITFYRTLPAMEVTNPNISLPALNTLAEYNNNRYLIAMMHEYEIYTNDYTLITNMVDRIIYACNFAQTNNYTWAFPMDRV